MILPIRVSKELAAQGRQLAGQLERQPGRVAIAVAIFFGLWLAGAKGAALFWSILWLLIVTGQSARLVFSLALTALTVIPFLYLLDRPAQAERTGVVAFSLLGLGILVNAVDSWRARHAAH